MKPTYWRFHMGKYQQKLTFASAKRRWKAGFGRGEKENYKPWLKTRNAPSLGERNRPKGIKTGRQHEYFSQIEHKYFLLLEWADNVIDIREQYPLWSPLETEEIAALLNVKHPYPPGRKFHVMTTDFVIDLRDEDGTERTVARSIKPALDLNKIRTLEKLEIERQYWLRRDIDWGIVTDQQIPTNLITNLERILPLHHINGTMFASLSRKDVFLFLTDAIQKHHGGLSKVAAQCDQDLGLPVGSSLSIAYHLIATKQWKVDLQVILQPTQPLKLLKVQLNVDV
jgi:hypothetical protein